MFDEFSSMNIQTKLGTQSKVQYYTLPSIILFSRQIFPLRSRLAGKDYWKLVVWTNEEMEFFGAGS